MPTIREDVEQNHGAGDYTGPLSVSEAADAFLTRLNTQETEDAENRPSEDPDKVRRDRATTEEAQDKSEAEEPEEGAEDQEDPDQEEPEDTEDEDDQEVEDSKPKKLADDDLEIEFTVDGETRKASVRDLKRLAGQEASLTRKSQEVAEQRKATEAEKTKYAAALDTMVARAREAFKPYAEIDFLVAQQKMDPESFSQLRQDAQRAHDTMRALEGELDAFVKEQQAAHQRQLREEAKECIKVLQDPERGIPGWSTALYDEIRTYGIAEGLEPEVVNSLTNPAAIKLLWKAMKHDKVQKEARAKVSRKVNAPTKVIKTSVKETAPESTISRQKALAAMRNNGGTLDSAAEAFLAIARQRDD
jgi:hypothetical protein